MSETLRGQGVKAALRTEEAKTLAKLDIKRSAWLLASVISESQGAFSPDALAREA